MTRLNLRLLSQGLPTEEDLEKHHVKPHMCLPVAPNVTHPTGREAMVPLKPFPWPNLYHHSAMCTQLRARSYPQDFSAATLVSMQDLSRMRRCWNDDEAERQQLFNDASGDGSLPERCSYPLPFCGPIAHEDLGPTEDAVDENEDDDVAYSSLDDGLGEEASFEDDADAIHDMFMDAILDGDDPAFESIPIIRNVEYDLSKVEHFDDPRSLFEEIAALKECVAFIIGIYRHTKLIQF